MSKEDRARLHAVVKGRVQGVGFRDFAYRYAVQLGLVGYVRNTLDGAVEVEAEGTRPALQTYLARLHEGPRAAWVARVDADWAEADGRFRSFTVRF